MARGLNRKRKKELNLKHCRVQDVSVRWSLPGRRSFSRQKWQECNFSKQRFAKEKKEKNICNSLRFQRIILLRQVR